MKNQRAAELWDRFHSARDDASRNDLVLWYLPIVRYQAVRVSQKLPTSVEVDDLVSAGCFGLIEAINGFDPARRVRFETYCVPRIRGAMLDDLRRLDWVPRLVRTTASKIEAARRKCEINLKRPATETDIAAFLGVSAIEFERLQNTSAPIRVYSLDRVIAKQVNDNQDALFTSKERVAAVLDSSATDKCQKRDLLKIVTKGMSRHDRLIIILYYYEQLTMKEIGLTLGLSESRISQKHTEIVKRLRETLASREREFI